MPGTLHAHGQLVKVHTVHFSVGLAGRYRLHVGLRQQSTSLPGSPFILDVAPGAAYAASTRLPRSMVLPRGVVGQVGSQWSEPELLVVADKMGNRCCTGGATVRLEAHSRHLQTQCVDHGDGSYGFRWRSTRAGSCSFSVTIDGAHVAGSPSSLAMAAGRCVLPLAFSLLRTS